MNNSSSIHEKMISLSQLLQNGTISISAFEQIHTILKGVHPEIDKKLEIYSRALDKLQKIQNRDIITLSVEGLPEDTEEKKKRKKALIFFLTSFKNLQGEIKRIDAEFTKNNTNNNSVQGQLTTWGRIVSFAKGPFGIVTIIALAVVGFLLLQRHNSQSNPLGLSKRVSPTSSANKKVQIITYNGKQIPPNQLYIGYGSDCDSHHYHAITGNVTTIDKTVIPDPENCGYGKVKDVQVTEVEAKVSPNP